MHTAVLTSWPWGPHTFFFSSEAALCSFCLFDFLASFKSQPTCLKCLHWPQLNAPPLLVPTTHLTSCHLAIYVEVCWPAYRLLPLPGHPWKEGHGATHPPSHMCPRTSTDASQTQAAPTLRCKGSTCFSSEADISQPRVHAVGVAGEHCSSTEAAAGRRKIREGARLTAESE